MYRQIVHFLQGQVRVRIECGCPERVLNLCGARGIPFWELTWESPVCLTLRAVGRDLPRLRQAAEDAGGSLHLCRSGGVPVFWRRLRRRCRPLPWERSSHSVSGRLVWQSRPVRVFSFPSRRPPT